jgi:DNA-binding transcriptional LysR family regulator
MEKVDWTLIRSFLAVAEAGSLSAAARTTGISQPTLGRHIHQAEGALQVPLFTRVAQGLVLTEAGQALLPSARAMRAAAADLALTAAGRAKGMEGTVRITASRVVSHAVLPPILAQLRVEEPGIQIDLVPSDTTENLLLGEADLALRMYRPTQLDLVAQKLADLPLGLYAARSYLDRHGRPTSPEGLISLISSGRTVTPRSSAPWQRSAIPLHEPSFQCAPMIRWSTRICCALVAGLAGCCAASATPIRCWKGLTG